MKITRAEKIEGGWALYGINEKEKKEVQVCFVGAGLPLEEWVDLKDVKK
jgi:hypothetical protein